MISNTIEMLFTVYSNTFLQKNVFFPQVKFSYWFMVIFSFLINAFLALFWWKFLSFFQMLAQF